jgi:very-short-patch-repair endonuclease
MDLRAFRVDPRLLDFARELRQRAAPSEQKLWNCLRNRQLNGIKFRRQFAIGEYVADFYCAHSRLIIELDGDSHSERHEHDAKRTEYLKREGYAVIRFLNNDVHENLDNVLLAILRQCESRAYLTPGPSPQPSPLSTGEREPEGLTDK